MNCTIRSLTFLFGMLAHLCATAGDLSKADIEQRFKDRAVQFVDVEVLRQHEPVFVGGLGPLVFDEFLKQYWDRSIRQQFKISTGQSSRSAGGVVGPNTVVLDGISKATASIRIANQAVLNSSFAVARSRLGFAGSGNSGPPAVIKKVAAAHRSLRSAVSKMPSHLSLRCHRTQRKNRL